MSRDGRQPASGPRFHGVDALVEATQERLYRGTDLAGRRVVDVELREIDVEFADVDGSQDLLVVHENQRRSGERRIARPFGDRDVVVSEGVEDRVDPVVGVRVDHDERPFGPRRLVDERPECVDHPSLQWGSETYSLIGRFIGQGRPARATPTQSHTVVFGRVTASASGGKGGLK